jgi:hypothetical protein
MILDRLRGKKKQESSPIARSDFLHIRPIRNPAAKIEKDESGKITLILQFEKPKEEKTESKEEKKEPKKEKISRRQRRTRILPTSSPPVKQRKFHLDTIGSIVWEMCDGEKSVKELVQQLHETYKMLPSEAEISLNSYFNELANRGLIAFLVPDDIASRLTKKEAKEEEKKQPAKQQ